MAPEEMLELRRAIEEGIELDARSALYDAESIRAAVLSSLDEELGERPPELVEPLLARIAAAFAAHADEEKSWRDRTDNDRLDAAFADLESRGIATGQALGLTIQEGAALIDERAVQRGARGSVFYHRQDLERAIGGGGLSLAFTAYENDGGVASIAVGRTLVEVLAHHGLAAAWDGSRQRRPHIGAFVWRRRRHTIAPPGPGPTPMSAPAPVAVAPAAPCAICRGRGWTQSSPSAFPEMCACRRVG